MLSLAAWVLSLAVIAGTVLAFWHLRSTDGFTRPPRVAGIAHGVVGTIGLALLLVTLRGAPRAVEAGAGSFGTLSAVLLGGAILTGVSLLFLRPKAIMMAVHAGFAVTGYVLFLAWNSLG